MICRLWALLIGMEPKGGFCISTNKLHFLRNTLSGAGWFSLKRELSCSIIKFYAKALFKIKRSHYAVMAAFLHKCTDKKKEVSHVPASARNSGIQVVPG